MRTVQTLTAVGLRLVAVLMLLASSGPLVSAASQDGTRIAEWSLASSDAETKDITLITRDPQDGSVLAGACYSLRDVSKGRCDGNNDGEVRFRDVPPGVYTVHQTSAPHGFAVIRDFQITVDDAFPEVPVGYVVRQSRDQEMAGTRNVSVIFVNSHTYEKVSSGICMTFEGASDRGCDDDLEDGQIDFLGIPNGTYPLSFTGVPDGWQVLVDDVVGPSLTVESGTGPQIFYIGVYVADGTSSGSSTGSSSGSSAGSGSSSGSTNTAAAAGVILMTFRGCPDGFNPNVNDYWSECTIPLDAPDAALILWGGDGQGGMNINQLDRQYDGTYVYTGGRSPMTVQLVALAPVVRNAYTVFGVDGGDGWTFTVSLYPGNTRQVTVFYYYQ